MLEGDVAANVLERLRARDDVDVEIEVLEDAVEERERALHVDRDAEQAADRREEARLEGGERDERRRPSCTEAVPWACATSRPPNQ